MTKQQEMMIELYNKGVSIKNISQATGISKNSIPPLITKLRMLGADIPYRIKTKSSKQVIKARKCEYTPGKACLSCPYDRCIASGKGLTNEEKEMFKAGFPTLKRSKEEIEVDNYYV